VNRLSGLGRWKDTRSVGCCDGLTDHPLTISQVSELSAKNGFLGNGRVPARQLLTVGHSSHPLEHFLGLLGEQHIEVLLDVRSSPYSRFAPQFNREALKATLADAAIKYGFLGRELGGRPEADEYYDEDGHVLYGRVAQSQLFMSGIERLERGLGDYRLAIMCSEEDPTHCHRRLLVTRVLHDRGVEVVHLRGDGRLQSDGELEATAQGDIFNGFEEKAWRSTRSVSQRRAPISSSAS
jgi:uncharacterized protein (DUF488 family)